MLLYYNYIKNENVSFKELVLSVQIVEIYSFICMIFNVSIRTEEFMEKFYNKSKSQTTFEIHNDFDNYRLRSKKVSSNYIPPEGYEVKFEI